MNTKKLSNLIDEFEDYDIDSRGRARSSRQKTSKKPDAAILEQDDSRASLQMTYKAARFEEGWLLKSLGGFYEHQWISDVLRKVRGGKEASVYLCRAGASVPAESELVAVKVYRPRNLRNLKQDHIYREGRTDLGEDGKRLVKEADVAAIVKRTAYGEEVRHRSWIAYEFNTLHALHAAGADVPRPYEISNNAIAMDYIGDYANPAPALSEISLSPAEANPLFERVLHNLNILLAEKCVHGDLSAYNILYWGGEIVLIDFPQVVSPENNRNAYRIFQRDVTRVCEYFARMGVRCGEPGHLAADLWRKHGYALREEIHPKFLDADDPRDRALWNK
jgi:RIO kinase 1